ncbi:aminotransferase class V-fold PLP-dependent enzyme, partial [Stella sp.]|uniref:aminotransferase class V-fold PLP-dependent enzyme n=1 Tax=Stella sp. TaxID=2912054 RepID=UPI0035AF926D
MDIDLERARRETPGVAHVNHMNNAGAALMPDPVRRAVIGHLEREAEIGGYEAADAAADDLERGVYESLARLVGAGAGEIAVIENATRAWDMAFYGLPLQAGDRILTAEAEYSSNVIAFFHQAQRRGAVVETIPSDETGAVDLHALARAMDRRRRKGRVGLVAITHVPTNGGLVNPAAEIGRLTRAAGVPYLLDACQSIGQMPVDVAEIGCDMLSATGRKFLRGPRGTGFLFVRQDFLDRIDPPFLDNHAATWVAPHRYQLRPDARRFENWESYVAGKLGLKAAADYALGWGLAAIGRRTTALADRIREGLGAIRGVRVLDLGRQRCGIVSFALAGTAAEAVQQALAARRIN